MPVEIIYMGAGISVLSFILAGLAFISSRKKIIIAEDDRTDKKITSAVDYHEGHCVGLAEVKANLKNINGRMKEVSADVKELLQRIPAKD